jgi:hypothetical protein
MRRVKSAPADLCTMVNRKRASTKETASIVVPTKTSRIVKKGDAFNQVMYSTLEGGNIHDSTEQLVFSLVVRRILFPSKAKLQDVVYELIVRAFISFVTQQLMDRVIFVVHAHCLTLPVH